MDQLIIKCFDNIFGYEGTKNELYILASALKSSNKCKELGIRIPKGVIFYGDPGLGKTTMALDLIAATERYSVIYRKENGLKFATSIKEAFLQAKQNQPSIILLDDMDKFSNADSSHRNTDEYVILQTCIDKVKNDDVVVVATANEMYYFPHSLLRAGRFDRHINIQSPSVREAAIILKEYLKNAKVEDDIDTESIARLMNGRSCAELETIINEAGIYAIARNKKLIDMDCMVDACLTIFYHAPDMPDDILSSNTKQVAIHEAGHAVAHELLLPNSTALVSTRISSTMKQGITVFDNSEYTFMSNYSKKLLMCCLAGGAAHEINFCETDPGAASDIEHAVSIASSMICSLAYNGIKKIDSRAIYESEHTKAQIDSEVNFVINKAYLEVKQLLMKNRYIVEKVADALTERKTLLGKDVRQIIASCQSSNEI